MSEKEYIVVVKKGVDLEVFDADLASDTGDSTIPERAVTVANPRLGSKRMTHWMLTDDEAQALKNDPRVLDVEIPVEQRDDIVIHPRAIQTGTFNKTNSSTGINWGLNRCVSASNNWPSTITEKVAAEYPYALDGTGVDVVIQDSGIEPNHPEWQDTNGNSRLKQIDWFTESGISGTQSASFYSDTDGHGTHCAGISAGKTYGWAKNAHIYAQKVSGLEGPADSSGISTANCFDTIRLWHSAKTNGRPTVVNMSWGYSTTLIGTPDPTSGTHYNDNTGVMDTWTYGDTGYTTDNNIWQNTGFVPNQRSGNRTIPVRLSSVDAEIDDMIDAGIHVIIAAGNDYTVSAKDTATAADHFNDSIQIGGVTYYYHRGSSPRSTTNEGLVVGSIDADLQGESDKIAPYSTRGPAVDILAPGSNIVSACSTASIYTTAAYPPDTTYKITNIDGTSFAAPQVAGLAALYLQVLPNLTTSELKTKILNDSLSVVYDNPNAYQGPPLNYLNYGNGLYGTPNKMMFSKYGRNSSFEIKGSLNVNM